MFNYSLPKWNKKISIRTLNAVVTAIYILSIVPLLVIGHFNWLASDDLAQAGVMSQYYASTGSLLGTFLMGFKYAYQLYMKWMGCYFSNLLFRFNPCIFGERMYFLVVYEMIGALTFGVCYFFKSLIVYGFKGDKYLANIVSMISLIIMIHSLPANGARVEAFYWYTGASNYTFVLGIALFWIGLLIRAVFTEKKSSRIRKLCWACFWGLVVAGINYMTALALAICSVLVMILIVMEKTGFLKLEKVDEDQRRIFHLLWLPGLFNLVGFVINVIAPGNAARQSVTGGFGPIKSVLIAFYYVFDVCINELTRWEVLVLLALLIPVLWKLAGTIEHKFEHPFIFALFSLCMTAAFMVPPLFAIANVAAGRVKANILFIFTIMLVLTLFYWTAWIRQNAGTFESLTSGDSSFSKVGTFLMAMLALLLMFGSGLCVKADPYYYAWSSAVTDLANGSAKTFYEESVERLEVLKDDSVTDVVLKQHTVRPELLAFDDVTKDPGDWINTSMANYYGKNSVVLGD